jgi:hypothetical protein
VDSRQYLRVIFGAESVAEPGKPGMQLAPEVQPAGPPCAPVKNLPTPYRKFLLPPIGRRRIINFCISASFRLLLGRSSLSRALHCRCTAYQGVLPVDAGHVVDRQHG